MFRLILLILFVTAIAVAALATITVVYSVATLAQPKTGKDQMPRTFQRIAYVALVVLLIGITSGWLGGV
jgi:cell division protein FtsX